MKLISANWSAPEGVKAVVTTREGGVSQGPFSSLNLGDHVGDLPEHVSQNRALLSSRLGFSRPPQWLTQVHGTKVIKAGESGQSDEADACWTDQPGQPCIVMTADCLPVFFTDTSGSRVAVAHAGWRGLADGVLEQTLGVFDNPGQVIAWLGPAIGPSAFEVGAEVREKFCDYDEQAGSAFSPQPEQGKWLADIYTLARQRLVNQGIKQISGGGFCTYTDQEHFFSYRREGMTGRMASIIWLEN